MELRIESVEGFHMPPGAYVGVRVGDVLKQGRYEPQRCYHFPALDRRRNAKIDVFRHVGSCVVSVDPDQAKTSSDVRVASSDPTVAEMMLKVNMQAAVTETPKQKEAKSKAAKSQAKDYLAKHQIEEKLSEAVKSLLKEQPSDPITFLCRSLSNSPDQTSVEMPSVPSAAKPALANTSSIPFKGYYNSNIGPSVGLSYMRTLHAKFDCSSPVVEAGSRPDKQEQQPMNMSVDALRTQARNVLFKASNDGSLDATLADVRVASETQDAAVTFHTKPSVGTWLAKPGRRIVAAPSSKQSFMQRPSVGTWCVPRLRERNTPQTPNRYMLPTTVSIGTGFHQFGLRPAFKCI